MFLVAAFLTSCCNIQITNAGLGAIASSCHRLLHVDLSECDKISSGGIVALANGCTNLLHVFMAQLYLVKDDAVKVS